MPSSTGTSYYRSRKVAARKTLQSPSKLSLISGITNASKGSNESNSTVTQESHSRSGRSGSKRRDSKRDSRKAKGSKSAVQETDIPETEDNRNLDVFAYLDHDEEVEDKAGNGRPMEDNDTRLLHELHPSEPIIRTPESSIADDDAAQDESQALWHDEHMPSFSIHSDSGISIRSSSPDLDSPVMSHMKPKAAGAATHRQHPPLEQVDQSQGSAVYRARITDVPSVYEGVEANPESFYRQYQLNLPDEKHLPEPQRRPAYPMTPPQPSARVVPPRPRRPRATTKRIGYDLLSSIISTHSDAMLKPIYRKFETLNNRILLYLQDEVAELEDELQVADAAIAREAKQIGRRQTSRRIEAKVPSRLQWQRLELLGRIFAKTEQYSRALSSYNILATTFGSASPTDIQRYRDWVMEHTPVAEQETSFLHHDLDLITVKHENVSLSYRKLPSEAPLAAVALTFVSIIVIFKVVPRFIARLVIGTVIGLVMLTVLSPSHLRDVWSNKSWRRNTSIYAVSIFILALLVG